MKGKAKCTPETRILRLAGQGPELGVERADVLEADRVLVAVVNESDLGLLLDCGRAADACAVPLAVGELGRDEVAGLGHEARGCSNGLVVERELAHELLERRDALGVEDLDREPKLGFRAHVADDDVQVLRLQRPIRILLWRFDGLLGFLVVVLPDLSEARVSVLHPVRGGSDLRCA